MINDVDRHDLWAALKQFTPARIAMGRVGHSITVKDLLAFKLAHAHARDAVYSALAHDELVAGLSVYSLPVLQVHSQAVYREQYLQRPDMGRRLNAQAVELLKTHAQNYDVALIMADGLSAVAINENACAYLQVLIPLLQNAGLKIAPLVVAEQGRVAIADEIGELLQARLSVIMIGERPGLSSADSMGVYITYKPAVGLTDESRNCISNIRQDGLDHHLAAQKTFFIINQAFKLGITGVALKDEHQSNILPNEPYNAISP